jgi:hypothetical protein
MIKWFIVLLFQFGYPLQKLFSSTSTDIDTGIDSGSSINCLQHSNSE